MAKKQTMSTARVTERTAEGILGLIATLPEEEKDKLFKVLAPDPLSRRCIGIWVVQGYTTRLQQFSSDYSELALRLERELDIAKAELADAETALDNYRRG